MSEIEKSIIELIFRGSLTLSAMIVAVMGFLLAQYASLIKAPSYMSRPYRWLAILMVIVLLTSATTSLLSLLYILNLLKSIGFAIFYIILILHVLSILSLVFGVVITTIWTLRRR